MSFNATVYRILIASPTDVPEERDAVEAAIRRWNSDNAAHDGIILLPQRWESDTVPDSGDRAQALTNEQIVENSDILVGIFWWKLGTPTGEHQSGTAEEIDLFMRAKKPVVLYTCERDVPQYILKKPENLEQYSSLQAIIKKYRSHALTKHFHNKEELSQLVYSALAYHIRDMSKETLPANPLIQVQVSPEVHFGSLVATSGKNPVIKAELKNSYFLGETFSNLHEAYKSAGESSKPVFGVIYDPNHPSESRLDHHMGYFLEYETTKKEISDRFVQALLKSTDKDVSGMIPEDDPLEAPRVIVMTAEGNVVVNEMLYANPDEGLRRSRAYFGAFLQAILSPMEKALLDALTVKLKALFDVGGGLFVPNGFEKAVDSYFEWCKQNGNSYLLSSGLVKFEIPTGKRAGLYEYEVHLPDKGVRWLKSLIKNGISFN